MKILVVASTTVTQSLRQELAKLDTLMTIEVATNLNADKVVKWNADVVVIDETVWQQGHPLPPDELQEGDRPPVLLLTEHPAPTHHSLGLNPDKDDYLVKPFTSTELIARMEATVKASANLPDIAWSSSGTRLKTTPSYSVAIALSHQGYQTSPKQYFQSSCLRLQVLESMLDTWRTGTCSIPLQKRAIREAHTLAGSLANLGFDQVAQLAQQITDSIKQLPLLNPEQLCRLADTIQTLRQSLEQSAVQANAILAASPQAAGDRPWPHNTKDSPTLLRSSDIPLDLVHLLIVDDDVVLSEEIRALAAIRNIHTRLATTLSDARSLVQYYRPNIVLLDLCFPNTAEDGLSFLAELTQIDTSLPVIVFTSQQGLTDRLNAARLGAKGFLQKPISASNILDALTQILQQDQAIDSKLLVMADDDAMLAHLDNLLKTYGFSASLHSDPSQFWTVLENIAPDLLILDVNSKRMNGLELCRVVRNDLRWSDLPIILLAEQTNRHIVQEVFAAGADDYVQKPVFEPELIARVRNRLERSRLLTTLAYTDNLTGLTNRCKATADIKHLLYLAERQSKPLSFIIFDLDRFKQINDHYGHAVGDQALRYTGYALKQTFRRMDVIARWGGDEFVLGLFDSTAQQSSKRISQLMRTIGKTEWNTVDRLLLTLTFSVGIAEYPSDGRDVDDLYQIADKALYHSKLNGRNRISLAQALHP